MISRRSNRANRRLLIVALYVALMLAYLHGFPAHPIHLNLLGGPR